MPATKLTRAHTTPLDGAHSRSWWGDRTVKTKVLTARVLRLLLQEDQKANRLLCLTFTRAAAGPRADREAGFRTVERPERI